jgi:tRNA pseudouridine38-40 synthase
VRDVTRVSRTIRLELAYDGTDLAGWQHQKGFPSAQAAVEAALAAACGVERVVVEGASRTDAGVHARCQVASARVETRLDDSTLAKAIQARLPRSIRLTALLTVRDGFHARFDAGSKLYAYRIDCGDRRDPFQRRFAAWSRFPLDIDKMREGAKHLTGRHDFAAFATAGSPRVHTVRTLYTVHVWRRRSLVTLGFLGDGFLYNQVRNMAGTLMLAGSGKIAPEEIGAILASRDRRRAGPNAPPEGLFLLRVRYGRGSERRSQVSGGRSGPAR